MIPKKIHYCWFGGHPLDEKALTCLESWKRFFPEYEIIRWDETNYDFQTKEFTRKAYEDRKWAFVSDVARLEIIYQHGGIYFDTDVEVIRSYEDILQESPRGFMGMDHQRYVNTGLGFGAEKGNPFIGALLETYDCLDYEKYRKNLSAIACPVVTNRFLKEMGIDLGQDRQVIDGIRIYPYPWFNPYDYLTGQLVLTDHTHSVHWYSDSWNKEGKKNKSKQQTYRRLFGQRYGEMLYGILSTMKREGPIRYIRLRLKQIWQKNE